jgi:hypothetical protein
MSTGHLVITRVGSSSYTDAPGYIRHVSADPPADTTNWGTRDYWRDISDEATTGLVDRRWNGSAFVPAP